jgi:4-hydroxy-2-oxoheptanedioate aldolase
MNTFKAALRDGPAQIGLWQALANSHAAEICAGAGFDWLLIDAEHAPNDLPLILAQLQAVAAYPVEPVVRLPVADPVLVKQCLDIGARTLLVPMIETMDMARQMVAATRYPPEGVRGVAGSITRASRWGRHAAYLREAAADIGLLLQIESRAGLAILDELIALDGVDGLFIGPADLAAALGHLGNPGHPDVQAAVDRAIAAIVAGGKAAGILTLDAALADHYLAAGARFVAVGTDVTLLARGADALAARFKGGGGTVASGAGY